MPPAVDVTRTPAMLEISGRPLRAIFDMAWPMTLRATMLHGIVVIDALLIAGLGEEALAAMGLATAIGGLLLGVLVAFSNATQILVAQVFGTGDAGALHKGLVCGVITNLCAACLGLLGALLIAGPMIEGSAHDAGIASAAKSYLRVFGLVVLAEAVAQSLSAHLNGCSETRVPFYSYLWAVPVNVAVSLILIYGVLGLPALGVTGAAVGSAVSAFVRVAYLLRHIGLQRLTHLSGGLQMAELWPAMRRHLAFSLPIAATFVSVTLSNSTCMLILARMSVTDFAAITLIQPWVQVAGTVGMSWAQAVGILVAQLLGRRVGADVLDHFLRQAWKGAFIAAAAVALIYLALCLGSGRIYADLQPETRAALLTFAPTLLLLPFPKGSNAICGNTLRAAGETVYVMHVFVWSQWLFRVPATAALVYLGAPVGWVFALLLGEELVKLPSFHLRIARGTWKRGVM